MPFAPIYRARDLAPGTDLIDVNTGEAFARILANDPSNQTTATGRPMVDLTTLNLTTGATVVSTWRASALFEARELPGYDEAPWGIS